jgi:transcriptional regulator with XRE-family HTH domain
MTFKELRTKAGLNQAQLAAASGVDPKTVWWIEHGKVRNPRYGTISALAEVLGCSPVVLGKLVANQDVAA